MVCVELQPCHYPTPALHLLCSYPAPSQLQLLPCPCCTIALLHPSSYRAPSQLLPIPSLLSALLCSTLLSSGPALLLPGSYFFPALAFLLACSCPTPALHLARAAFYGNLLELIEEVISLIDKRTCLEWRKIACKIDVLFVQIF